jgi:chromosome segregation ATPase
MDLALRKAQEDCTESYLLTEGLKLERELNAANEMFRKLNIHALNLADRIKRLEEELNELGSDEARLLNSNGELERRIRRLEEAGDVLCAAAAFMGWHMEIEKWRKAKEVKP